MKIERKLGVKLPRSKKKKSSAKKLAALLLGESPSLVASSKRKSGCKKGPVDLMKGLRISRQARNRWQKDLIFGEC